MVGDVEVGHSQINSIPTAWEGVIGRRNRMSPYTHELTWVGLPLTSSQRRPAF